MQNLRTIPQVPNLGNLNTKAHTPAPSLSKSPATPPAAPPAVSTGLTKKAETRICKRVRRQGQRTSQPISRAPPSNTARGPTPIATPPPRSSKTLKRPRGGATQPTKKTSIRFSDPPFPQSHPQVLCALPTPSRLDPRCIFFAQPSSAGSEPHLHCRVAFILFSSSIVLNEPRQPPVHQRPGSTVKQFALPFIERPAGQVERWTRPSENGAPLYPRWNSQADFG